MNPARVRSWFGRYGWLVLGAVIGLGYFVLAQRHYLDQLNYTFVIGTALLHGHLGVEQSYAWLNEMVPYNGWYYSVFPLGAVLSVLPFCLPVALGWTAYYPVPLVLALLAAATVWLSYGITLRRPDFSLAHRLALAVFIPLISWYLPNMVMGGAWQLALGFAVLGELGAIYFTLVRRRPWLAGICFAIGFGNRTEIILAAPVLMYFLLSPRPSLHSWRSIWQTPWLKQVRQNLHTLLAFLAVPVGLGVATLLYNLARFGSVTDFGYSRIPGLLQEPLYRDGFFSFLPIPTNAATMLWNGWRWSDTWPFALPDPFGSSIIWSTPFLLLLFWRWKRGDRGIVWLSWIVAALTTFAIWMHGNTGGWQFSYRYALVPLPWLMLILIERLPSKMRWFEIVLWAMSGIVSVYGLYLFFWSVYAL